jgi:hypothetical protein
VGRVLLIAIPQVDVVPDGFDWWNGLAGTGGFVAALVAIVIAVRAQKAADQGVTEERRRVFELEILRDLMRDLDETKIASEAFRVPRKLAQYELRLGLLSTELELWKLTPGLGRAELATAIGMGDEYREAMTASDEANAEARELNRLWNRLVERDGFAATERDGVTEFAPPDSPERTELDARLKANQTRRTELRKASSDLQRRMYLRFRERLADNVRQAIWSRVEARPFPKPTRWRRVWRWIVNEPV